MRPQGAMQVTVCDSGEDKGGKEMMQMVPRFGCVVLFGRCFGCFRLFGRCFLRWVCLFGR